MGSSESGAKAMHLELLTSRTVESTCGWTWSTPRVHYADEETEAQVATSLCMYCSSFIFRLMYLFLKKVTKIICFGKGVENEIWVFFVVLSCEKIIYFP